MTLEAAQKIVYRELGLWTEGPIEPCCGQSHADPMPPLTDGLLAVILRRLRAEGGEPSIEVDSQNDDSHLQWYCHPNAANKAFDSCQAFADDPVIAAVMAFAQYLEARK